MFQARIVHTNKQIASSALFTRAVNNVFNYLLDQ